MKNDNCVNRFGSFGLPRKNSTQGRHEESVQISANRILVRRFSSDKLIVYEEKFEAGKCIFLLYNIENALF